MHCVPFNTMYHLFLGPPPRCEPNWYKGMPANCGGGEILTIGESVRTVNSIGNGHPYCPLWLKLRHRTEDGFSISIYFNKEYSGICIGPCINQSLPV